MFPAYWKNFLSQTNMENSTCQIPHGNRFPKSDGEMVYLYVLDELNAIEEATVLHPGKTVEHLGYIPVAVCEEGTGDIYCIKRDEGENGPIYRVFHDALENGKSMEMVFKNYTALQNYKCS